MVTLSRSLRTKPRKIRSPSLEENKMVKTENHQQSKRNSR